MHVRLAPNRFLAGRLLMLAFLAILIQRDLFNLFTVRTPAPELAAALALLIAICAIYAWFWLRIAGTDDNRRATVAVVALTALVVGFVWLDPNRSYPFFYPFYYCAMVAGAAYPWRFGLLAVALVSSLAATVILLSGGRPAVATDVVLVMVLLGLTAVGVRRHVANFVQLQMARDEIRRLAVSEERLRLSRDLHDELGQALSTVVLQSELVALELPGEVSARTRDRLRHVIASARGALQSMRLVLTDARLPSLQEELASAGATLEAAGITCDVRSAQLDLPRETEAVLAWAVREGTTNVLRHSQAGRCRITISANDGLVRLSIVDNGAGSPDSGDGKGLQGIRERLEPLGGRLSASTLADHGFDLTVEVPTAP
jgi:two-component system, NarL family, sensor histidine kinase DesK